MSAASVPAPVTSQEVAQEFARLRGEMAVLREVLAECHKVLSTIECESTDEDEQLRDLLRKVKRLMLLRSAEADLLAEALL